MKSRTNEFVVFILIASSGLFFVAPAHALIFLPPLLLLPLISILGGMTAILSVPTAIFSAMVTYWRKPKTKKHFILNTILTTILILSIVALIIFILLKLQNPDRPTL